MKNKILKSIINIVFILLIIAIILFFIIPWNSKYENDINTARNSFNNEQMNTVFSTNNKLKTKNILKYYKEIQKWINTNISNINSIIYYYFWENDWYKKYQIIINGEKEKLLYTIYYKWNDFYWSEKLFNNKQNLCYIYIDNCSNDIKYIVWLINKLKLIQ